MTYFARYQEPDSGFATVAGRYDGLSRIMLAAGQLGTGEGGPVHSTTARRFCGSCPVRSTSRSAVSGGDARPGMW